METQNEKTMQLLQIADSCLPTGGYAYSNGLESAASLRLIRHTEDLKRYLLCYLQQVYAGEMPYIASCYNLELPFEEQQMLFTIIESLDAFITIPEMFQASLIQGNNYFRIFVKLFSESGLKELKAWFVRNELNPHFSVVFGLCMKSVGYSFNETRKVHYHITLRDQVSAAIRLGLIGPLEGSGLHKDLLVSSSEIIASAPDDYEKAAKRGPLVELFQGIHYDLYSRLFQT